ncbi:MAG: LCP family protein [Clostridia bacterium]|nr:LCP family protein [Clostridia bacterium]
MKSPSQAKVSAISFLIALIVSLAIFGLIAYFAISGIMFPSESEVPDPEQNEIIDVQGEDPEIVTPDDKKEIEGDSFTVLVAGYDLQNIGFDAMVVLDVNKESKKATVYPINVDTKVYVGHGASNSLNIRTGDLIKYKDMDYVLDKINATTGLKIEYYVTFTAEGFIEAFDAFNKSEVYTYKVPKDMEHVYYEAPVTDAEPAEPESDETEADGETDTLEKYNISFKKGDVITSGIDVYNMLRYKGDSASDRITRQGTFMRDIITKIIPSMFKESNLTAIIDTAKGLIKLTDSITTNISVETFITEGFDLISAIPSFSIGTATKYTSGITNFK